MHFRLTRCQSPCHNIQAACISATAKQDVEALQELFSDEALSAALLPVMQPRSQPSASNANSTAVSNSTVPPAVASFSALRTGAFQRVYISEDTDAVGIAACLLMASAAVGAACFRLTRWHCSRHMPSVGTVEREREYQLLGMSRPRALRPWAIALAATLIWVLGEGALFFISQPAQRPLQFAQALEHVVVDTPRNLVPSIISACTEVRWSSGRADVKQRVRIARCVQRQSSLLHQSSDVTKFEVLQFVNQTILMLPKRSHTDNETDWLATTKVYSFDRAEWFDLQNVHDVNALGQAFAAALEATACSLASVQPTTSVDPSFVTGYNGKYSYAAWRLMCSGEQAIASTSALRDVWLGQIDLGVSSVQDDRGFGMTVLQNSKAAAALDRADSLPVGGGLPASVEIGTVKVARVNLVSAAIIAFVGIVCYFAVTLLPDQESAAALLHLREQKFGAGPREDAHCLAPETGGWRDASEANSKTRPLCH
jgi:hypothetical protein